MIKEYRILKHHGRQFIPDLTNVELTPLFRGRPVISEYINEAEIDDLINLCPTSAFVKEPFGIDLGKCVFCKECEFRYPDKIHFSNDYKIATNDPGNLIIRTGNQTVKFNPELIREEIRKLFSGTLKLRQVSAAGDNSCEMELNAAGNVNFDMGRFGIEFVASPRHADGIVITGPISENMAEALQICYDAIPAPKIIILVGTDAISGGIFAGSPALNRNFLDKYHVDLYIPGNPAHPLTFINGILSLLGKL
jgi:Ni,Fe-hydrogenase III small subunit